MLISDFNENPSIDYDIIAERKIFEMFQAYNKALIEQGIIELDVLSNAFYNEAITLTGIVRNTSNNIHGFDDLYESLHSVSEVNGVNIPAADKSPVQRKTTGLISRVHNFIRRMLEFIQDMLQKFLQTAADIIQSDTEWINKNETTLKNIPENVLNDMRISCTPYFLTKSHGRLRDPNIPVKPSTSAFFRTLIAVLQKAGLYKKDRVYKDYFPELFKINPNNIKDASMIFFKGRIREVRTFQGRNCLDVINIMINFCRNYKVYTTACKRSMEIIQASMKEQESYINRLKEARAQITNSSTSESFDIFDDNFYSILEDANIFMSELDNLDISIESNLDYILEDIGSGIATSNVQTNPNVKTTIKTTGQNSSPNRNFPPNQQQQQQQNQGNVRTGNTKNLNVIQKGQLAINDIQQIKINTLLSAYQMAITVATSKLTVCELIHNSYMKVLRGVVEGMRRYEKNNQRNQENIAHNYYVDHREEIERRKEIEAVKHRKARRRVDAGILKRFKGLLW